LKKIDWELAAAGVISSVFIVTGILAVVRREVTLGIHYPRTHYGDFAVELGWVRIAVGVAIIPIALAIKRWMEDDGW